MLYHLGGAVDQLEWLKERNAVNATLNHQWTRAELVSKVREVLRDQMEKEENGRLIHDMLTQDELNRRRSARSVKLSKQWECLGPRWGISFTLYAQLSHDRSWIATVTSILEGVDCQSLRDGDLIATFNELTALLKNGAYKVIPEWRHLIDLSTLGWYLIPSMLTDDERETLRLDAIDWLSTEHSHIRPAFNLEDAMVMWYRRFWFAAETRSDFEWITFDNYCQDPFKWAKDGASSGKRLQVMIDDVPVRAKHTKWSTAIAMTENEVREMMLGSTDVKDKVFVKMQETTKWRLLVNSNFEVYLKMNWILANIKRRIAHHQSTPLFWSDQVMTTWRLDVQAMAKNGNVWFSSLDQSGYDHQVTQRMKVDAIASIREFVLGFTPIADRSNLTTVFDTIEFAISNATVDVFGEQFHEVNGIPSGWSWTALLDTIINYAQYSAITEWLRRGRLADMDPRPACFFGDDIAAFNSNEWSAINIITTYNWLSFVLKLKKLEVNRSFIEFLRLTTGEAGTQGYPARMLTSILVRRPGDEEPWDISSRSMMLVSQYSQLHSRMVLSPSSRVWLRSQISKACQISSGQADQWMSTHQCDGGIPVAPVKEWQAIRWQIETQTAKMHITAGQDNTLYTAIASAFHEFGFDDREIDATYSQQLSLLVKVDAKYKWHTPDTLDKVDTLLSYSKASLISKRKASTVLMLGRFFPDAHIIPTESEAVYQLVLERMIRQDRFDEIAHQLLDYSCRDFFLHLKKWSTKGVWLAWLRGDWAKHSIFGLPMAQSIVTRCTSILTELLILHTWSANQILTVPAVKACQRAAALRVSEPDFWDFGFLGD